MMRKPLTSNEKGRLLFKTRNPSVPAGHLPLAVEALKQKWRIPPKPLLQGEVARSAGGVSEGSKTAKPSS